MPFTRASKNVLLAITIILCSCPMLLAKTGSIVLTGLIGDINSDGYVNVGDLQLLVAKWGQGPSYLGPEDINGDGYVNVGDLQLLVAHWGQSADITPPAAVTNLAVSNPTTNSLTLTWTTPSDPDSACTAYDIRYSTSPINAGNFPIATQVTGLPTPGSPNTSQNLVVSGLWSGTTYYFALKTSDAVGNWSLISNVPSGATAAPAPVVVALKRDAGLISSGAIDPRFQTATVRTVAVADTGLYNAGDARWMNSGACARPTIAAYMLYKFDLSSIPTNATINLAQLRLYHTGGNGSQGNGDVSMVLTHDWTEGPCAGDMTGYPGAAGGASFAHPNGKNTNAWQNASGGTTGSQQTWGTSSNAFFDITVDAGSPLPPSSTPIGTGYHVIPVTAHVQQWVSGAKPNFGWAQGRGYWDFHCSEAGTALEPVLFIDYTPGAGDTTPPAAIAGLSCDNITAGSVRLNWSAPADFDSPCTAYDIRYSTSAITAANFAAATQVSGAPSPAAPGTSQNMVVSGLSASTTYYFAIKTSDAAPNWSAISNVPSATTLAPPDTTPPAAVTNLATSSPTTSSITLTWTAPSDPDSACTAYDIRYSTAAITTDSFSSAAQVAGAPTPATSGTNQSTVVTGLSASTTYYFAIKTSDAAGNWSDMSNVPSATTLTPPDTTAPAAVSNLSCDNVTSSSIRLNWSAPSDPDSACTAYDIRYSTSAINTGNFASAMQATGIPTPVAPGTSQSLTFSGLPANTTYYFAIKTSDAAANWSGISNLPSATTLVSSDTTPPAAITDLSCDNITSNSIRLSWTAPSDPDSPCTAYDIRYSTSSINASNFSSAVQVLGVPVPAAAGTGQNMTVSGLLASTKYYFAIKTSDVVPNWSAISNLPTATTTAPSQGPITILHTGSNTSGWRGAYNISSTYCWVSNWGTSNADAEIGQFDRTALQNAVNTIYSAYSGWDARMILSQVNWNTTQPPGNLTMVAGSADLNPSTVVWEGSNAFNAGNGSWTFNGTGSSDFYTAVNAGTASGRTVFVSGMPYTTVWDTGLPLACWDIVMDIPESLINAYLQNPTALGLFASCTDATGLVIHANDQWSHQANIRIVIQQPPQTAPWIGLNTFAVGKIIALTSPTDSQTINVTNAGTGTLTWTATPNPSVSWMTITNGSGTGNGSFTANFNVTSLTAGNTYTTKIRLAATGATNTPQDINVSVKVVANASPIIQLAPTSLSYDMAPTDAPLGQNVTVTNVGLGTLNWTTTVQGSASWLTLTNTSGTSGQAFTATVNPTGLAVGTYTANIQVSASGASNSPQTVAVSLSVRQKDANITTANSYDNAWETGPSGWIQHCTNIMNAWTGKTDGFVVHVGDSITYAAPYSAWARYGQGKSAADTSICNWTHSNVDGTAGSNSTNSGWWLARYDVPNRAGSYTARSGIRADQYLAGLTYPDLPGVDQMFTSGFTNPDGKQYRDAEICVLMLGTNDVGANRTSAAFIADLGAIVDKMLAANVIVAVSTLPPRFGCDTAINDYNTQIRSMAQAKAIPLIDFYQEVVRRRPNGAWMNTLISGDGVHPSSDYGGSHADSDPYANNGDALSNSGYLLRDWLSVQKIQEIKTKVLGATTWNVSTTSALQNAVASYAPGDTISIAAGTYTPTNRLTCNRGAVTIKGATGNRDDVIIQGPGMAVNVEPVEMFDLYSSDVTIKDLTIRNVYTHGIHIRAEVNVDRTHVQNVHTLNCGERHIKCSFDTSNPSSISDDVLIENCLLEQTQANTNHSDNDYIAGIDLMGVNNLIIRDNVIKNIVGPTGGARAGIFIWHHNTNCTIERNQIYGCDRGISMCNPGWAGPGAGSSGGIIRNNMVVRGVNIALELCFTDSMKVYYNTIYSDDASYYRTVSIYDDAGIFVTNNLQFKYNIIRGLISNTSAGTGNVTETGDITGSTPATNWFINPSIGDLHLTSLATGAFNTGVLLPEVPTDFDNQTRGSTPDIGADETSY